MTTRNVDLLIRARDGASKAFKEVSAALEELGQIQGSVADKGKKLDQSMTAASGSATTLARQIGSQTAGEAQKAAAVFQRIEETVAKNTRALDQMGKELLESEARYASLKAEAKAAEQAIVGAALAARRSGSQEDKARLNAAQGAYRDLNREIARSEKALITQQRGFKDAGDEMDRLTRQARGAVLALGEVQRVAARARGASDSRVAGQGANEAARRGIARLAQAEQQIAKQIADRQRATAAAAETYRRGTENAAKGIAGLAQAERRVAAETRARAAAQANANASRGVSGLAEAEARVARSMRNTATAAAANERAIALLNERYAKMRAVAAPTAAEQAKLAESFRRALNAGRAYRPTLRQIARELAGLGPASNQAADGVRRVSSEMLNGRRAFRAFYGDSRRALSLMQRIRGEVLSLTASFVGFYGIFQTGRGFLESFQSLEAAQNRLGAAFNQDYDQVASEMERLQGEAARLGISFDTLSDNYSKFLLSGQQAGLEIGQLRTIFRQVSESGRVLKLSNEQIEGTFTALTQIAGKGTLQMEELRQQLGDRLPGAVGIVAGALGYASGELSAFYKAVENGQISAEDALVALGNGLEETYGGQLEDALDSVTAKLGELQNLFFQRQITAANSGFIQGLEEAVEAINSFLDSREGVEFFEALGAAFQRLTAVVPILLENLDLLVAALQAFVAIKLGQVAAGFAANLTRLFSITVGNRRVQVALNAAVASFSPAAAAAMASATRLGVALRGLRAVAASVIVTVRAGLAAVGGVVGIAAAALSFFAFEALAGVNEEAAENREQMRQVQEIVGKVGEAYRLASGDADKFGEALSKLPLFDMKVRLREAGEALADLKKELLKREVFSTGIIQKVSEQVVGTGNNALYRGFDRLQVAFRDGEISARELLEGIRDLGEQFEDLGRLDSIGDLLETLEEMAGTEEIMEKLAAEIAVVGGTATEAQRELLGLEAAVDDNFTAVEEAKEKFDALKKAMSELAKNVPELKEQLEDLDTLEKIQTDFENALKAADAFASGAQRSAAIASAVDFRNQSLNAFYDSKVQGFDGTDGVKVAAQFLRDRESFRATPYNDPRTDRNGNQVGPNVYRAGYGSDTVTLDDGSIVKITQGMRVSVADAERDLDRRIRTEFAPAARNAVGAEKFDALNAQQQAALISLAYNYGAGAFTGGALVGVANAVRTGTDQDVANAIRERRGDNGGVNARRRAEEAALFTTNAGVANASQEFLRAEEESAKAAAQKKEDQEEALEALREGIRELEFEASIQDKRLIDKEVEKALDEERAKLAKVGLELSEEQAEQLERAVRAKFQSAQADEDRQKALEKAKALEEQVTLLQERRRFLLDQRTQQEGQGDQVGVARTSEEIALVEEKLDSAIVKALEFWQALGGEGAERAILGLQTVQQELQQVESKAIYTGEQINQMIGEGIGGAVTSFAEAVANGENAWDAFRTAALKALSDILIQIGQAIIQQVLLNALTGGGGGGAGGGVGGFLAGAINSIVAHGGGIAGGAGPTRRSVNPAIFANAARYHGGGIAGLAPGEIPAILEKGEEILTEADPRHRFNGGASGGRGEEGLTIINTFDADEVVERALSTPRGQRALVNAVRGSNTEVKAALG